jgi:hypothetical protein
MKKRRYQATNVKQVNWNRIATHTQDQHIVCGVDVAKEDFFAVLMKTDRTVLETIKWQHPQETRELVEHLLQEVAAQQLVVVMEPSGTYGDALRHTLIEQGIAVYRVSPKRVSDAAEIYDGVPSLHDAKAAYLIGRLHLDGASALWEELSVSRRDHHALIAELDLYQSQYQANLNRLEAHLSRHWPEVTQLFDLSTVSLQSLLAEYGSPEQIAHHRDIAAGLLRRTGRGLLRAEKIQQVLDSSATTLGLPCTVEERHLLQVLGIAVWYQHKVKRDGGLKRKAIHCGADAQTGRGSVVCGTG